MTYRKLTLFTTCANFLQFLMRLIWQKLLFQSINKARLTGEITHRFLSRIINSNTILFNLRFCSIRTWFSFLLAFPLFFEIVVHASPLEVKSASSLTAVRVINQVRRSDVVCPDNMAIRLPDSFKHAGGYISCEDFDEYIDMINAGREVEALFILLAPPGSAQLKGVRARERRNAGS